MDRAMVENRNPERSSQKCDALEKAISEYVERHPVGPTFDPNEDAFQRVLTKYGALIDEIAARLGDTSRAA